MATQPFLQAPVIPPVRTMAPRLAKRIADAAACIGIRSRLRLFRKISKCSATTMVSPLGKRLIRPSWAKSASPFPRCGKHHGFIPLTVGGQSWLPHSLGTARMLSWPDCRFIPTRSDQAGIPVRGICCFIVQFMNPRVFASISIQYARLAVLYCYLRSAFLYSRNNVQHQTVFRL